jgi:hypothetical protein
MLQYPFSEDLHGAIQELKTELSDALGFIHDPAPEMVVEKVDFPRHANTQSSAGFGNR